MAIKLATQARNWACDGICGQAALNNGYIRIYTATQPSGPNDASSGTLLAELRLNATDAFGAAATGVATAGSITDDTSADATGTAAWFRVLDSGGVDQTDNVFDGTVGTTAGYDMQLNTTSIQSGATVSITSMTFTIPES